MVREETVYTDFKQGKIDSLYAEMYAPMMSYAARFLTNDYAMMAEDTVQEAIIKAYQTRGTFSTPYQLKSFLFTCIHNNCISVLRKVSSHQNYVSQPQEVIEQEFSASMIEQETIEMLHAAIRELPEKYQQLFELNYEQGLKNEEVARLLDISINGFNKRKAKMISLLREKFKDQELMQMLITVMLG
ncbi:MAG: sigma-70 family RNA polymerase sigma factor [Prevotella sp.]|nr:sigma-70 family RNA polymerase sigma factor [Prevotella sp.]